MLQILKTRWPLFLVLLAFIICAVPHLDYPYYWDESWPYAPAIRQMFVQGISLMPNAVDSELSRGHPLFFHAIAALWMHIFGSSHIAMHSFALLISVLFLVAIYETGIRLFNPRVAFLALILVACQELFFVQSTFVLLEILVAFLVFVSLYFYVRGKYLLTILSLSALFYTKESGLILGAVLGLDAFFSLFGKNNFTHKNILSVVSVAVPCLLTGIFFLLQKHIRGWYIFPFYHDLIEHNWLAFWYKFRMGSVRGVFSEHFIYLDFILLLLLSLFVAAKNKKAAWLVLLLPAILIYFFVDDIRAGHITHPKPFFALFILSIGATLFALRKLDVYENKLQRKYIELSAYFIIGFLCFSATNFFSYRYLLAAIIPALFFAAVVLDKLTEQSYKVAYYPLIAAVFCISYYAYTHNYGYGDGDMDAFKAMKVQSEVVAFFQKNNAYDSSISSGSFMARNHLTDPYTGFLPPSSRIFKNVKWDIDSSTAFVIMDDIEPDSRYGYIKTNPAFHIVFSTRKDSIWTEIYEQKK